MKIKNVYYSVFLFFAVFSLCSCSDVENKESYTGRSEGPATKLNVLRNGEAVGDAIQFSMGASSIILGVDCDGDWTAEVDGDWADVSNHAGYGYFDRNSYLKLNVNKNEGDARTAVLTFKSGTQTRTITLNQNGTGQSRLQIGNKVGDSLRPRQRSLEPLLTAVSRSSVCP